MKDLLAWFGLKAFPFDKNLKTQDVLETEPFKESTARLDYIKRRGGILLLTGDPGVGKTLVLRPGRSRGRYCRETLPEVRGAAHR
jgi:type II secretory pathway predicted ATPase ExeA